MASLLIPICRPNPVGQYNIPGILMHTAIPIDLQFVEDRERLFNTCILSSTY